MTRHLIIAVAAFIAGAINSIAGGGTLISFPALVWAGVPPVIANATNTVAIWPGSVAAMLGFRRELASLQRWLYWLIVPSLVGGIIGAMLLLRTPEKTFSRIVPFLILGATLLLAVREAVTRNLQTRPPSRETPSKGWLVFAFSFQLLVGIYGGYFGAGIGILMLAALGIIGLHDMHEMNALKNLLAICMNGIAAVYFILHGAIDWSAVLLMAITSIIGGYAGARMARRLGRTFVRNAVVVIGLVMTVILFIRS